MNELVCNYAIARFRPYRETGEFVNVGVVLVCPETGYFDHLFETHDCRRVTNFFPKLEVDIFQAGLRGLVKELTRLTDREREEQLRQPALHEGTPASLTRFRELVRPREALFHFSEARTVMTNDPVAKLRELFEHYVRCQQVSATIL